ncbi:MAG: adenylate/guanylate cyclase domain-containing protein [Luteolibacter sp.]|uniref:CHASE2 domain-containing protein n=1 Tax=Luteolibacter sp. TaxID=1962973 RepID=UPI003267CC0C
MKPNLQRPLIVLAICAACTLVFVFLSARGFVPLQQVEFFAQDWQMRLGRKTPVDERLVLIGIDKPVYTSDFSEEELQAEPVLRELQTTFPWSRAVWARLIEKLADAGAKVIVIDLVFAAPGAGDDKLNQALEKYRDRIVIGYNINVGKTDRGEFSELMLPAESVLAPAAVNSPVEDDRLGYVNIWPDFDDTLRNLSFRQTAGQVGDIVPEGVVLESLDARTLRKSGHAEAIPPGYGSRPFRYTAPAGSAYKPCPIGDILSPKLWEKSYASGGFFKDKIILLGPTAEIFHDEHNTPFIDPKKMGGPEIHLQVLGAALHGEFIQEPSQNARLWIITLAGVVAAGFCFVIRQPAKRLLAVVGLCAAYMVIAQVLFDHAGRIVPLAVPLLVLIVSSLIVLTYDFVLERLERMKLRNTMGLYFSPKVLEAVLADPGSMEPRRADVTLLLTDLRNSTPLAEALGPQGMFELLNLIFEAQTNAIMAEEGNLEHFLGDQFLSYWGAPQAQPDAADRAHRAAIQLITAMEAVRPKLSPEVHKLFGYGVALHSGAVLVGNKGSAQRLDYGLVGDTVNEASRVEALTKYYGVKLLVTSVTFGQFSTRSNHRLVDRVIVKGKSEPVELFEFENPCTTQDFEQICRRYQTAYSDYSAGRFTEARAQFESLVLEYSDGPGKVLVARCTELEAQPPTEWHGIWKMDAK